MRLPLEVLLRLPKAPVKPQPRFGVIVSNGVFTLNCSLQFQSFLKKKVLSLPAMSNSRPSLNGLLTSAHTTSQHPCLKELSLTALSCSVVVEIGPVHMSSGVLEFTLASSLMAAACALLTWLTLLCSMSYPLWPCEEWSRIGMLGLHVLVLELCESLKFDPKNFQLALIPKSRSLSIIIC